MRARMLQIGRGALVALHVRPDGVQCGKGSIAFGARERLGVAVLVAGQLDVRLERLGTERTLEGAHVRMDEQMVVVDGWRFEAGAGRGKLYLLELFKKKMGWPNHCADSTGMCSILV